MRLGRGIAALAGAVMVLGALAVLFPLFWVIRTALKTADGFIANPAGLGGGFTFENFQTAWVAVDLGGAIFNSISITIPGAAVATCLGTLAGYGLAKTNAKWKGVALVMAVGGLTIPIAALAIPAFDQALQLGYLDTRLGLIATYGAFFASWTTLFFYSYFQNLPDELIEAAELDGASRMQTFARIAVPLAAPAIAVGFVLNVFLQWSEVLLGLVMLPGGELTTVMSAIASFSTQFRTGGPPTAAATIIVALPIFAMFVGAQRWLSPEIFSGSIKG